MSRTLGIAITSTQSLPGDLAGNLAQIRRFAQRAASEGMDLLLTPELSASGYGGYPGVFALAEEAGKGPIFKALLEIARENHVAIGAGFPESANGTTHLAHTIVFPDGDFVVQRKWAVTEAEKPFKTCGDVPTIEIFEVAGVRCAIFICADFGWTGRDHWLRENGIEVVLLPTGAGGKREDRVTTAQLQTLEGRETFLRIYPQVFWPDTARFCLKNGVALAAVNLIGYDGREHYHGGHGSITNALGEVVGFFAGIPNLDRQKPCYTSTTLDLEEKVTINRLQNED